MRASGEAHPSPPPPRDPSVTFKSQATPSARPRTPSVRDPSVTLPTQAKILPAPAKRHLAEFNKKYLGLSDYDTTAAALGESFYSRLTATRDDILLLVPWTASLPSKSALRLTAFGRSDPDHSFTQEASFETCLLPLLKSGYLSAPDTYSLLDTHPLVSHLATSYVSLRSLDFRGLRDYNPDWATQTHIPPLKQYAMLACLFHYDLDTSLLMRFLGNNYTGAHREISAIVSVLRVHKIDPILIDKYVRVMLTGCPNRFVAETSRANALLHWRMRNHPSIDKKLPQVQASMNKEDRNNFVIPLPHWIARFTPHLFFTPQHILEKPGKKDRQIFDASRRYTPWSTPINMMTSTRQGSEEPCLFGSVKEEVLARIYSLRAENPTADVVTHANDVKSAFRQIKLHPDIMGAFSYIISDQLFLSCGQPFGADFCPANWEVVRQVLEKLSTSLFHDDSLRNKHRKYLDRLKWDRSLGKSAVGQFAKAVRDPNIPPPRTSWGSLAPTPHHVYVDDGIYVDWFDVIRIERAAAASIEAIFILLGPSALDRRQDPISFDKLEEMVIGPINRILGHIIDTRRLTIDTPEDFLTPLRHHLRTTWGPHRKSFSVHEAETLAGQLGHVSFAAPWLRHLMPHVYQSLSAALGLNRSHLVSSSASFRFALKQIKHSASLPAPQAARLSSFYQADSARSLHHARTRHHFNRTLRAELHLIRAALTHDSVPTSSPISHLVNRTPLGVAFSDSSLLAAGGYSPSLRFWWYLSWPHPIRLRTLKHINNNADGQLIDINVLEYAAIIINYIACYHAIRTRPPDGGSDPHPIVLLLTDNSSSEAWAHKGARVSFAGRALGRLQAALMIANPVGFRTSHVPSKENVVADTLSRFPSESSLLTDFSPLCKTQKELSGCYRFHPNAELISCIMDALLKGVCIDPIALNKRLLTDPGRTISSPGAPA